MESKYTNDYEYMMTYVFIVRYRAIVNHTEPVIRHPYYQDNLINFTVLNTITSNVYAQHKLYNFKNMINVYLRVGDVLDKDSRPLSSFLHTKVRHVHSRVTM